MAKQQTDIRRWALIGAEQRLLQLAEEEAAIHRAFPELRRRGVNAQRGSRQNKAAGEDPSPGRKMRRKMSVAARKRISQAQKARWAKQRAEKK